MKTNFGSACVESLQMSAMFLVNQNKTLIVVSTGALGLVRELAGGWPDAKRRVVCSRAGAHRKV